MTKITLTDLVNLQNETTAVNAINNNNATLETASDNTLSRDGTAPNQMLAALDMNSNRIVNLPSAITLSEPLTMGQASQLANGSVVTVNNLPTGGTTGQALKKNSNTDFDVVFGAFGAAAMPAYTGDVTSSVGTTVNTIAANAVTNAKAAQMAAFTLKGNSTGSTANATDILISGLTAKATPATSDLILISDEAASHALKKATLATSAVTSIAGNRGDFTLGAGLNNSSNVIKFGFNGATADGNPADPTGTTSAVGVMMGLGLLTGGSITPAFSTRVKVDVCGTSSNTGTGVNQIRLLTGTGTAPSNGAALTGSTLATVSSNTAAAGSAPFCISAIATVTVGVASWFDLSIAAASGTGTVKSVHISAFEF